MDRTAAAVSRQLQAMGGERFEAGIRDGNTGKMLLRAWPLETVLHSLPWLKSRNAAGFDIYIRPDGPTALVLLDDLTLGRVKDLKTEGLEPCCVTQTSPQNYQAWVRLAEVPLPPEVLTASAKILAKRFHGDPASATQRHFGRLAGFTNRKPNRVDEHGCAPFVLLESHSGRSAPAGGNLVQEAGKALEASRSTLPAPRPSGPIPGLPDPVASFLEAVEQLREEKGKDFDASIADWRAASMLIRSGYLRDQVILALRNSPDLEDRKHGHVEKYINITISKLWP